MKFYVGLHYPGDAKHFDRACISVRRLQDRKRKHLGKCAVILDSGAFKELEIHGEYQSSPAKYAAQIRHLRHLANIEIAVAQDYMCESFMLRRTGLTIAEHHRLTVERYDDLLVSDLRVTIMPVLQGYEADDYVRHIEMYGDRLVPDMWVGVGSVCKRNGRPESVLAVVERIRRERPDLRLHGFGVKKTALLHPGIRSAFHSTDSLAWSFAGRRDPAKPKSARNDWREAMAFKIDVESVAARPLEPWQMVLL